MYRIGLPMGDRAISVHDKGQIVPAVVIGTVGTEKTLVPPPIDRRDVAQNQGAVLVANETLIARTQEQYAKLKALYPNNPVKYEPYPVPVPKPVIPTQTAQTPPIVAPPITTKTGGTMDLGSIITDLGKAYITTKYAPKTSVPLPTVQPAYSLPEMAGDVMDYFVGPSGEIVPVEKKKKCRRRRRRLATKSDLGDLAALKAILGNGEAFKAWIATHSR